MPDPITVRGIVRTYLEKNCYDGLFNADSECACNLDDLMCCMGEGIEDCEAGHWDGCKTEDQCGACADGGRHMERGPRT